VKSPTAFESRYQEFRIKKFEIGSRKYKVVGQDEK
jgi:hypothetical protein